MVKYVEIQAFISVLGCSRLYIQVKLIEDFSLLILNRISNSEIFI